VVAYFGVKYITEPRYEVLKESISISLTGAKSTYKISPAEIKVTNLWKGRPLTFKVDVTNINNKALCIVRPSDDLGKGYIKLNKEDYKITIYPTDFSGENLHEYVIITIEKLKLTGIEKNQQQSYSFSESIKSEKGKISIARNYVLDIFIE
jgi:hypothetical protein